MSWWGNGRERNRWGNLGLDGFFKIRMYLWGEWLYRALEVILEGKRPLGRARRTWVDTIRMGLWGDVIYKLLLGKP